MHKKAMVIGGGIAGIQAALDLADMGVETFLVERSSSIGGRMAQLDKTFPTNDCAMCILSPKLVEAGSHPCIRIISNAELLSVDGEAPSFTAKVLKHPRYVDEEKCNGCGVCMSKCPAKIPDRYNEDLCQTRSIHIPFPQAVPAVPLIDVESCIYFKRGKCRVCERFCGTHAIDFEQQPQHLEIEVGAIILAAGAEKFDARLKGELGFGTFPNVVNSLQFERLMAASGPNEGHLVRPSDRKTPKKIGFVQCVGSRDTKVGNHHCSSICCMQTTKVALVAIEHMPEVETTVFFMDIRAYGKAFDRFVQRAKHQGGTRFLRGRVSAVETDALTDDIVVQYNTEAGENREEVFDMLVLSVGLLPSPTGQEAARRLGLELGSCGFVVSDPTNRVVTTRPGVFACGSIAFPKDIPESVIEASGAASAAAAILGDLPRAEFAVELPPERDVRGEPPRVGAFVCRCGINIAGTVDVPAVVHSAAQLPRVVHAQETMFSCSQDSLKGMREAIDEHGLNRVVVAACTPRTHEPLFQKNLREAGLNPYLFEFVNIREQCAWVHQRQKELATAKATDLVRMAVSKAVRLEPMQRLTLPIDHTGLVVGGGIAGMVAALDLADQGYDVHLVERQEELGGNARHVRYLLDGGDPQALLQGYEDRVRSHPHVRLHTGTSLDKVDGFVGNFVSTLVDRAGRREQVKHGIVVVATGGQPRKPDLLLLGQDDRVMPQLEFESELKLTGHRPQSRIARATSVVMVQCVGSRSDEHPYCSRVCCRTAVKNALAALEINPRLQITILYRDIRTFGLNELYYAEARRRGVRFVRFEEERGPRVSLDEGRLTVDLFDEITGRTMRFCPELLVTSTGIGPNEDNRRLSQMLKVPLDADGFFLEAHVKLRPVDFATDGIFVCGLAHYPKDIPEATAQARAAAGRAATVLSRDFLEAEGKVSYVREELCNGCGRCVPVCAYSAIDLDLGRAIAVVNEALCKGCGSCAATCLPAAIDLRGFKDEHILSVLAAV
jgi:heterodisulfide reductase subunit A2